MPKAAINDLVNQWLREELDRDLVIRSGLNDALRADAIERGVMPSLHHSAVIAGSADADLERMIEMWETQDWQSVQRHVAPDIAGLGVVDDRGTAPYIKLAKAMFTAMAHLKQAQIDRSAGQYVHHVDVDLTDYAGESVDVADGAASQARAVTSTETELTPAVAMPTSAAAPLPAETSKLPGSASSSPAVTGSSSAGHISRGSSTASLVLAAEDITLADARLRYMAQLRSRGGLGIKAISTHDTVTELLEEVLGAKLPMTLVKSAHLGLWKDVVLALPSRRNKVAPGLGYEEAMELAAGDTLPKIDNSTVKSKYVSPMKQFFRWAKETGLIASDPSESINHRALKRPGKRRNPFNGDDLRKIFSSPLYTGCKSDDRLTDPGDYRVRDHRFWMPLVALYTGARLGEICQLQLKDVAPRDGIWCFDINDEGEKSVKSEASKRLTPVHPELIKLGLIEYVEQRKAAGGAALWPGVRKSAAGIPSDLESKRLNRLLGLILGEEYRRDRLLSFHSFRGTMIDAMREAAISEDVRHAIVGHEGVHVEQKHYGEGYKPKALVSAISKVSYPIDLSALFVTTAA
jgi:integrase